MSISKKQRFGIIVFIILIIAAILVTLEPWKKSSGENQNADSPEAVPSNVINH
jgi:hypothetical protein